MASMDGREPHDLILPQPLTPREQEVLSCIGANMTNRQIAEHLTIARSTVTWYVRQIHNKLGVDNRGEAISQARSLGLLPSREERGGIRHNLPRAMTPFAGRERELAALAELIADPQIRIITLTGPGGIGKTRLAQEAAWNEIDQHLHFADGVFFISLAPIKLAEEIVATLATTLHFHFQIPRQRPRNETQQMLDYLRGKQLLMVMDNFEHIPDGSRLLNEICVQAKDIKFLVTSRERVKLRGVQHFPLLGLEIPSQQETAGDVLERYPAAQIFLNIARRSVHDFKLSPGDAEHLIRICQLVEGLPLGLELAASWVGLLPLSSIATELEQSLQLLTTEYHDVPERHRSMQATLDVSWKRLNAEQKQGFRELTVFRGGFTRPAAMEITGMTLPLLVTLVNKSWLSYDLERDRYSIHELLRQYGAEKLTTDTINEQAVQARHSAYFCHYLNERESDWFGARQQDVVMEVQEEIDNIQRAWLWAATHGAVDLLAQGLESLCRFYRWEGRMKDGQHACRSAREGLSKNSRHAWI